MGAENSNANESLLPKWLESIKDMMSLSLDDLKSLWAWGWIQEWINRVMEQMGKSDIWYISIKSPDKWDHYYTLSFLN